MYLSHPALAYLAGRDQCTEILALMTPTQLLIAFLRASGHSDSDIASTLDLAPSTVTRTIDTLAEQIAEALPELRVTLQGRPHCPSLTPEDCPEASNDTGPETPPPLSVPEVAERLHLSPATIRHRCQQGHFPNAHKDGARWKIPEADLDHVTQSLSDGGPCTDGSETLSTSRGEALSTAQAARRLDVSVSTIQIWCRQGRFPGAYRDQSDPRTPWRIPLTDLADHLPNEDTLTVDEVAQRLDLTPRTIRSWCQQGRFPHAHKPPGRWRIPGTDLPTT